MPQSKINRGVSCLLLALGATLWPAAVQAEALHAAVERQHDRFSGPQRGFAERAIERARRYLPMIRAELARQQLPAELAWMPLLESGFRADARSRAGALGLWQLMPDTARRFGLRVDRRRDERLDPVASTRAAVAYLKVLMQKFDSWPLVLAAYNAGEGKVERVLAKAERKDFPSVARPGLLPTETREYVPAVIALAMIGEDHYCADGEQ